MKPALHFILTAAALLTASVVARAATADISAPKLRVAIVERAQKLVQPQPLMPLPSGLKDPFNPPDFKEPIIRNPINDQIKDPQDNSNKIVPPPPPPRLPVDRELLEAIAKDITPTGTFVIGGERLLIYGSKRLKVGDTLPIIYKDKPVELTITAIDDFTFTLRLRAEEFTRPIKSAASKQPTKQP